MDFSDFVLVSLLWTLNRFTSICLNPENREKIACLLGECCMHFPQLFLHNFSTWALNGWKGLQYPAFFHFWQYRLLFEHPGKWEQSIFIFTVAFIRDIFKKICYENLCGGVHFCKVTEALPANFFTSLSVNGLHHHRCSYSNFARLPDNYF